MSKVKEFTRMNQVCLETMSFRNPYTGEYFCGYLMYDHNKQTYCDNLYHSNYTGLELLQKVVIGNTYLTLSGHRNKVLDELLDYILHTKSSILINGEAFTYEEIEDILLLGE